LTGKLIRARKTCWNSPRHGSLSPARTTRESPTWTRGWTSWGFEIRRFGGKLLTKPSKAALRQIRNRLSAEVTALRGANADAVIGRLNPIITGWAAYYRIGSVRPGL
jgi:RNA-directed DNA polymerase